MSLITLNSVFVQCIRFCALAGGAVLVDGRYHSRPARAEVGATPPHCTPHPQPPRRQNWYSILRINALSIQRVSVK